VLKPRKRQLLIIALVLAIGSVLLLVFSLIQLRELQRYNRALLTNEIKIAATGNHLAGKFVRAWQLHQQGKFDEALVIYNEIESKGSDTFQRRVRYNQADLYLQQASEAGRHNQQDIATPLIELAKHLYRQLLREDSQHWPSKYNLETALKLQPDLDPDEFPDDVMPERSPEAAGSVEIDRELP